jgi:hypothetical protein
LSEPYLGGITLDEAFWRTLAEDFAGESFPADPVWGECLQLNKQFILSTEEQGIAYQFTTLEHMRGELQSVPQDVLDSVAAALRCMNEFQKGSHFFRTHGFAITEPSYMAIVPAGTQPGDIVAVMQGAPAPHILRSTGDDDGFLPLLWRSICSWTDSRRGYG